MEQDMTERNRRELYIEWDEKISQATKAKGRRTKDGHEHWKMRVDQRIRDTARTRGLCTGSQMLSFLLEIATLLWLEYGKF